MKKFFLILVMCLAYTNIVYGLTLGVFEFDNGMGGATLTQNTTYNLTAARPISSARLSLLSNNISTIFSTNSTGLYIGGSWSDPTFIKDGNTASCADIGSASASNILEFNLTSIAANNVYWADVYIWDESQAGGDSIVMTNYSLPLSCQLTSGTRKYAQMKIQGDAASFGFHYYCRNTTGSYVTVVDHVHNTEDKTCELKVRWFQAVKNPKVYVNNTVVYSYSGIWTGSNDSIDLTSNNAMRGYMSGGIIPVRFGADFGGLAMTWSDLDLRYNNSIGITIKDEVTGQILNQSANILIVSEDFGQNITLLNGSDVLQGIPFGSFRLTTSTNGYRTRDYYLTVAQESNDATVELFMLNLSHATYTNFVVQDETGNPLESATVKALRHFVDCNCFKAVEMDVSNFNGIATLSLQQYEGRYKFIVEYEGETVYSTTAPEGYKITGTSYTLTGRILGDNTESYFATGRMYHNLVYNNDSKLFTLTLNDPSGLVDRFCLYVDQQDATSDTGQLSICSSCLNASSGSINCNVTAYTSQKKEIIGKAWVHTNTTYSDYYLDVLGVKFDTTSLQTLGVFGVFIAFIFIATVSFALLSIAGLVGGIIGFDLGLFISAATGLVYISTPLVIGVVLVSFIVLVLIGNRS